MEPLDPPPASGADAAFSGPNAAPSEQRPNWGARIGPGIGAVGGLGALAGFLLPWFIFVVAIANCHMPLQIELYDVVGAALALNLAGAAPMALALVALVCALVILIVCLMALARPTARRANLLLLLALIGLAALSLLAMLASAGQMTPRNLSYAVYLGLGPGFWLTVGALLLAWVGGAVLRAAMRPRAWGRPITEGALAALGVLGLLGAGAAAIVVRPAPYPSLTCARQAPLAPDARALYLTSADAVYALDAATGRTLWRCRNPLGGIVTNGPPALDAGALIVASRDGYVYAIRASDAAILWRANVGEQHQYVTSQPSIAPIVAQGVIYGVNGAEEVYALRARDGAQLWLQQDGATFASRSSRLLLAGDVLVYLTNLSGTLHMAALDSHSGRLLWQATDRVPIAYFLDIAAPSNVQVAGALLYAEEIDEQTSRLTLTARATTDGAIRWRHALPTQANGAPTASAFTLADDAVYLEARPPSATPNATASAPRLVALRATDGSPLWSVAVPDGASAQLAQSPQSEQFLNTYIGVASNGESVYVTVSWRANAAGDTVYAVDARRGAVRWRYDASQPPSTLLHLPPHLALTPGSVYLLDSFNSVAALDARTGAVRWQ